MLWNTVGRQGSDFNINCTVNHLGLDDQLYSLRRLYNKTLQVLQSSTAIGDNNWVLSKSNLEEILSNKLFNCDEDNNSWETERNALKCLVLKNLAKMHEKEGNLSHSLTILLSALEIDATDQVILNRIAWQSLSLKEVWICNAIINCEPMVNSKMTFIRKEVRKALEEVMITSEVPGPPSFSNRYRSVVTLRFYEDNKEKSVSELIQLLSCLHDEPGTTPPDSVLVKRQNYIQEQDLISMQCSGDCDIHISQTQMGPTTVTDRDAEYEVFLRGFSDVNHRTRSLSSIEMPGAGTDEDTGAVAQPELQDVMGTSQGCVVSPALILTSSSNSTANGSRRLSRASRRSQGKEEMDKVAAAPGAAIAGRLKGTNIGAIIALMEKALLQYATPLSHADPADGFDSSAAPAMGQSGDPLDRAYSELVGSQASSTRCVTRTSTQVISSVHRQDGNNVTEYSPDFQDNWFVDELYEFLYGYTEDHTPVFTESSVDSDSGDISIAQFQSVFVANVIQIFEKHIIAAAHENFRVHNASPATATRATAGSERGVSATSLSSLRQALWSSWRSLYVMHRNFPEDLLSSMTAAETLFIAEISVYFLLKQQSSRDKAGVSTVSQEDDRDLSTSISVAHSSLVWILATWSSTGIFSREVLVAEYVKKSADTQAMRHLWVVYLCKAYKLVKLGDVCHMAYDAVDAVDEDGTTLLDELVLEAVRHRSRPLHLPHMSDPGELAIDVSRVNESTVLNIMHTKKYSDEQSRLEQNWMEMKSPRQRSNVIHWIGEMLAFIRSSNGSGSPKASPGPHSTSSLGLVGPSTGIEMEDTSKCVDAEALSVTHNPSSVDERNNTVIDVQEQDNLHKCLELSAASLRCLLEAIGESLDHQLFHKITKLIITYLCDGKSFRDGFANTGTAKGTSTPMAANVLIMRALARAASALFDEPSREVDPSVMGPDSFEYAEQTMLLCVQLLHYSVMCSDAASLLAEVVQLLLIFLRMRSFRTERASAALIVRSMSLIFSGEGSRRLADDITQPLHILIEHCLQYWESLSTYLSPQVLYQLAMKAAHQYNICKYEERESSSSAEDLRQTFQDETIGGDKVKLKNVSMLRFLTIFVKCVVSILGRLKQGEKDDSSAYVEESSVLIKVLCLTYKECHSFEWDLTCFVSDAMNPSELVSFIVDELIQGLVAGDNDQLDPDDSEHYKSSRKLLLLTLGSIFAEKFGVRPFSSSIQHQAMTLVASASKRSERASVTHENDFSSLSARKLLELFCFIRACDESGLANRNELRNIYAKLLATRMLSEIEESPLTQSISNYLFHSTMILSADNINRTVGEGGGDSNDELDELIQQIVSFKTSTDAHLQQRVSPVRDEDALIELREQFYFEYAREGIDGENRVDSLVKSRSVGEADAVESHVLPLIELHFLDLKYVPRRFESWWKMLSRLLEYMFGVIDELAECCYLDALPKQFYEDSVLIVPALEDVIHKNLCMTQGLSENSSIIQVEEELKEKFPFQTLKSNLFIADEATYDRVLRLCTVKNSVYILLTRSLILCDKLLHVPCEGEDFFLDDSTPYQRRISIVEAWEGHGLLLYHLAGQYQKGHSMRSEKFRLALTCFQKALSVSRDGGDGYRFFPQFMCGKLVWQLNRDLVSSLEYMSSAALSLEETKSTYSSKALRRCKQALMYQTHAIRLRCVLSMLQNIGNVNTNACPPEQSLSSSSCFDISALLIALEGSRYVSNQAPTSRSKSTDSGHSSANQMQSLNSDELLVLEQQSDVTDRIDDACNAQSAASVSLSTGFAGGYVDSDRVDGSMASSVSSFAGINASFESASGQAMDVTDDVAQAQVICVNNNTSSLDTLNTIVDEDAHSPDADEGEPTLAAASTPVQVVLNSETRDTRTGSSSPSAAMYLDKEAEPASAAGNMESSERLWRIVANAMQALLCCRRRDPFDTRPLYRIAKTLFLLSGDSDESASSDITAKDGGISNVPSIDATIPNVQLEPPDWLPAALGIESPTDTISSEVNDEDAAKRNGVMGSIPVISAGSALREMAKMFDRRRDQIVALWMPEIASCKIDQVMQRNSKFQCLRRKYISFYLKLLAKTAALEKCLELLRFIRDSPEESTARRWMRFETQKCIADIVARKLKSASTQDEYKVLLNATYLAYCDRGFVTSADSGQVAVTVNNDESPGDNQLNGLSDGVCVDSSHRGDDSQSPLRLLENLLTSLYVLAMPHGMSSSDGLADLLSVCSKLWPETNNSSRSQKLSNKRLSGSGSQSMESTGSDPIYSTATTSQQAGKRRRLSSSNSEMMPMGYTDVPKKQSALLAVRKFLTKCVSFGHIRDMENRRSGKLVYSRRKRKAMEQVGILLKRYKLSSNSFASQNNASDNLTNTSLKNVSNSASSKDPVIKTSIMISTVTTLAVPPAAAGMEKSTARALTAPPSPPKKTAVTSESRAMYVKLPTSLGSKKLLAKEALGIFLKKRRFLVAEQSRKSTKKYKAKEAVLLFLQKRRQLVVDIDKPRKSKITNTTSSPSPSPLVLNNSQFDAIANTGNGASGDGAGKDISISTSASEAVLGSVQEDR